MMICSKCGEQCNENQAFCLKCGSPLEMNTDFNEIEKKLADSIGQFMTELEDAPEEKVENTDSIPNFDFTVDDIDLGLKVVDINRDEQEESDDEFEIDDWSDIYEEEDITPIYVPNKSSDKKKDVEKRSSEKKNSSFKKTKKNNKKLYTIIGVSVALVILAIVGIVVLITGGKEDKKDIVKDYSYYYTEAKNAYDESEFDKALEMALKAIDKAENDEDVLKARQMVSSVYDSQNFKGEVYYQNLEEIFALGDNSEENAKNLLDYYMKQGNTENVLKLYRYISKDSVKEYLGDRFVEGPTTDTEQGQYNNSVEVILKAEDGRKIYYALCDDKQTEPAYEEYIKEFEIETPGDVTVYTYSVDESGVPSYISTYDYTIVEGASQGPEVSPQPGTYTEATKIKINVPEGYKAYFTVDGTEPTTKSEEYTEEVDMPRGVNTFMAILVDKKGNVSECTSVLYNLKIPRKETLDTAKAKAFAYYKANGVSEETNMSATYTGVIERGSYEYYIYKVIVEATETTDEMIDYCAVNTYDGSVIVGVSQNGGQYVLPESEEEEN